MKRHMSAIESGKQRQLLQQAQALLAELRGLPLDPSSLAGVLALSPSWDNKDLVAVCSFATGSSYMLSHSPRIAPCTPPADAIEVS